MAARVGHAVKAPRKSASRDAAVVLAGGAGAGAGVRGGGDAAMADAPPGPITLFVQPDGAAAWAEVIAAGKASVARLTELAKEKLAMTAPLHALTLHVAEVDDADKVLAVTAAALPSRKTLRDVGLSDGASIVVKESIAPGAGFPLGDGAGIAPVTGVKRTRSVAFDVPPNVSIHVRDVENKHKPVRFVVPNTWAALLESMTVVCGYTPSHRLYYSSIAPTPTKKKLASEDDFKEYYRGSLDAAWYLPDIWMLRAAAAEVPSPEQLPAGEAAAAAGGGGTDGAASSSGRSSVQQSAFREAVLRRDADDVDPHCALCSSISDVQAAHIMPLKRRDESTFEEGLDAALKAAELSSLYDTCNGFLLCDQCHDFFDAYLWSVDSELKVVVSDALAANVPDRAAFKGKQLFADAPASPVAVRHRPPPGVWAWHLKAFEKATTSRRAEAKLKLFDCSRCKKRFVTEWRKNKHENTCTAASVPAKHFFTPAPKAGPAASSAADSAAGGWGASPAASGAGGRGPSPAAGGGAAGKAKKKKMATAARADGGTRPASSIAAGGAVGAVVRKKKNHKKKNRMLKDRA